MFYLMSKCQGGGKVLHTMKDDAMYVVLLSINMINITLYFSVLFLTISLQLYFTRQPTLYIKDRVDNFHETNCLAALAM